MKKIIAAALLVTSLVSMAGAQELFNYDVPSEIASEFTMNRLYIDFDSGSMGGNMSRSSRPLLGNGFYRRRSLPLIGLQQVGALCGSSEDL